MASGLLRSGDVLRRELRRRYVLMVRADAAVTVSVRVPGPAGAVGSPPSLTGQLAHTGFGVVALVLVAVLLVAVGLVLVQRDRIREGGQR
jgi:hypothetical protein